MEEHSAISPQLSQQSVVTKKSKQNTLFVGLQQIQVRCLFIAERIDLKSFESSSSLATSPLTITVGQQGCAVLFKYGTVVLFNVSHSEEAFFLNDLKKFVSDLFTEFESEELTLNLQPKIEENISSGILNINVFDLDHIHLVANILARSVVLSHYEFTISNAFDRIEPFAMELERGQRRSYRGKEILRHIGNALGTQHKMVGRAEIEEKPELLWEKPQLERLYFRLTEEYELRERYKALEHKLKLINDTAQSLLQLMQDTRILRVEWYIVILIAVEILLILYELFFK